MAAPKKPIQGLVKLQIPAGSANPAPPVGPALGQQGVNIMEFCKQYNERTKDVEKGLPLPVVITVFKDRTFTFITKTPPASVLIRKAAGLAKGSAVPHKDKVGKVTKAQIKAIAEMKMPDLNAVDIAGAMRIIEGTARSMGVDVVEGGA